MRIDVKVRQDESTKTSKFPNTSKRDGQFDKPQLWKKSDSANREFDKKIASDRDSLLNQQICNSHERCLDYLLSSDQSNNSFYYGSKLHIGRDLKHLTGQNVAFSKRQMDGDQGPIQNNL